MPTPDGPIDLIRIVEVFSSGEVYSPTGREIQLEKECPLFQQRGWSQALTHGMVMVSPVIFQQLLSVIDEIEDSNGC